MVNKKDDINLANKKARANIRILAVRSHHDTIDIKKLVQHERWYNLLEALRRILEHTRVEKGCIIYHLYEDIEHRNTLVLLQK